MKLCTDATATAAAGASICNQTGITGVAKEAPLSCYIINSTFLSVPDAFNLMTING